MKAAFPVAFSERETSRQSSQQFHVIVVHVGYPWKHTCSFLLATLIYLAWVGLFTFQFSLPAYSRKKYFFIMKFILLLSITVAFVATRVEGLRCYESNASELCSRTITCARDKDACITTYKKGENDDIRKEYVNIFDDFSGSCKGYRIHRYMSPRLCETGSLAPEALGSQFTDSRSNITAQLCSYLT